MAGPILESKDRDRAWEALLEGYRHAVALKEAEQARLYRLAGSYLVGAIGVVVWLTARSTTPGSGPISEIPPLPIWVLHLTGSVVNTFYVAFYSYSLTHLLLAARLLDRLAVQAQPFIGESAVFLRWGSFSAGETGLPRRIINSLKSIWLLVPLTLAIGLPFLAMSSCLWCALISLILAIVVALVSSILSILQLRDVEAQLGSKTTPSKEV